MTHTTSTQSATYRIAVVGPPGAIGGFRLLGAETFPADDAVAAAQVLRDLVRQTAEEGAAVRYAAVLVVEDILRALDARTRARIQAAVLPAVVAIPGLGGASGYMRERLRELTVRAVGTDL